MLYCKRCGYETNLKRNLLRHLQRKIKCEAKVEDINIDDYISEIRHKNVNADAVGCIYCNKKFNSPSNKYKHQKICKQKPKDTKGLIKDIEDLKEKSHDKLQDKLQYKLQDIIQTTSYHIGTINIGNVGNQQFNNIKNFGNENMEHITKEFLNSCLLTNNIVPLIETIHFDKEHPENHNVKLKSTKQELMETYIDGKWIITDKDETLDELINKGYRVLNYHTWRNKTEIIQDEMNETEYDNVVEWLEKLYKDKKIRRPIKKQVLLLFMNNKTMLLEKDD